MQVSIDITQQLGSGALTDTLFLAVVQVHES